MPWNPLESSASNAETIAAESQGLLLRLFKKFWGHPLTRNIDIDSPATISTHRRIILSNPTLKAVYRFWYGQFVSAAHATAHLPLPFIEVGAGASHLEKYIPEVVKTDVVPHDNIERVVDAEALPYPDAGLRGIVMVGVLHHLRTPAQFLKEAQRCLVPGGRLVLIEPSNSPLHRFMIKKLHPHEFYDGSVPHWVNSCTKRLSVANNALAWIIFERDRQKFEKEFPNLKIRRIRRHTLFKYYLSGGLSYRPFFPSFCHGLVDFIEWLATPLTRSLGTMMTIEVERVSQVHL